MSTVPSRTPDDTRDVVRTHYAAIARAGGAWGTSCCGSGQEASLRIGYTSDELESVPPGTDMGLGCGTPLALAGLREGETVLDLGSGGGLDCFLAGRAVGGSGRVIGVDMTPDMVARARRNAEALGARNVEFRLGEIEHLPVEDASVDVIVSNCVVNLSPDKPSVFRESFRVLRPGGRLVISDIVASAPLPDALREDRRALAGCIAGAPPVDEMLAAIEGAGFTEIRIDLKRESQAFIQDWLPGSGAEAYVASAAIHGVKPRTGRPA